MSEKRRSAKKSETKLSENTLVFLKTQVLALGVYLPLFLAASVVTLKMNLDASACFYAAISVFAAASFACAYFAGYKIHKNGLVTGLVFALPANAAVLFASIAANSFKPDLTVLITLMILLIASMLGGVLSVNTRLKAKRK